MTPEESRGETAHAEPVPLVDLIAAASGGSASSARRGSGTLVGTCIDERHPQLTGRVRVRIEDAAGRRDLWVATLTRATVRRDDRVLLLQPDNWPEPIVVGVLDGVRPTAAPAPATSATLTIRRDEQIEIRDQDGAPLLAIVPGEAGPVLRLARSDQRLEIAGRLAVAAEAIELRATGPMTLAAGGDVVVTGEEIALN